MEKQSVESNEHMRASGDLPRRRPGLLEILGSFNPLGWFEAAFGVWWHRPWGKILRRKGWLGLWLAVLETAAGGGDWRIYIPRAGDATGWEMEKYLGAYGVRVWGRGFDRDYVFFTVKKEQAAWAEYLLKRKGVDFVAEPVNPLNDLFVSRHAPGSVPRPGDKPKTHMWMDFWSGFWNGFGK